jgi:hypothetical protein
VKVLIQLGDPLSSRLSFVDLLRQFQDQLVTVQRQGRVCDLPVQVPDFLVQLRAVRRILGALLLSRCEGRLDGTNLLVVSLQLDRDGLRRRLRRFRGRGGRGLLVSGELGGKLFLLAGQLGGTIVRVPIGLGCGVLVAAVLGNQVLPLRRLFDGGGSYGRSGFG